MSQSSRSFKDAIYAQLARIGKSLGSGPRLELLDILCQGPRTVESLAKQAGQSVANTSHHLQVLRRARLVDARDHEGQGLAHGQPPRGAEPRFVGNPRPPGPAASD